MSNQAIKYLATKLELATAILVFLIPVLMATVNSSVTSICTLLVIIGVVIYFKKSASTVSKSEKNILWGFVLVFVVYFLGMLNSENIYDGFKKLGKFDDFLLASLMFFALKKYSKTLLEFFIWGLIISGLILLTYVVISNEERSLLGAYHSIMYGDFAILIAGIGLIFALLINKSNIYQIMLFVSSLASVAASFIVGARGSWVALPFLAIILLWLFVQKTNLRAKTIFVFSSLIIVTLLVFTLFPGTTKDRFMAAVNNTTGFIEDQQKYQHSSSGVRLVLWKASFSTFKNHPLIGTGSGDFQSALKEFITANPKRDIVKFTAAHNVFFEWLATMGGIGFLVLIICVFLLPLKYFFTSIKSRPESFMFAICGIWVVVSSMVFGLTESWIIRSAPNGVYVFFVLLFMALISQKQPK